MAEGQGGNRDSDTAASTFAVLSPVVSPPKGGGAIRGIGEKLTVNPVTGTGSMSVPITTSPDRSGPHEQQLQLARAAGVRFAIPRPALIEAMRAAHGAATRAVTDRLARPLDEDLGMASSVSSYDAAIAQGIRFEGLYSVAAKETSDLVIGAQTMVADAALWTLDVPRMTPLSELGVRLWLP
jgi:predicted nucleic acid-binding protein